MNKSKYMSQLVGVFILLGAGLAQAQTPPAPPPGGQAPARPNLTKEQVDCLHKTLGAPSPTNKPTPQQMAAAFKTCKIQMPAQSGGK
jgi:hypothetical protein